MMAITFIRHGNTDWNNEKRAQGHSANSLSALGKEQAHALGKRLMNEGPWDIFIVSDLKRAKETANIISEYIKMPITFMDQRIREIGRGQIQGTIEEERIQKWGKDWRNLDLGVEKKCSVRTRGVEFTEEMLQKYPNKKLLVVSHGILILETLKGLLKDEEISEKVKNTSVTKITFNGRGWKCLYFNCTKHFER